jgi:small acid-soluble spore protein tlp
MKGRPADRDNNVRTTKNNINKTSENIEFANELMAKTTDPGFKSELDEKNKRRE